MMRTSAIICVGLIAGSLIVSAIIVRSGLVAIADQMRDKPIPKWPEQIRLVTGDSKVNLEIGNLSVQQSPNSVEAKVSIDNIRITTPATQPTK